MIFEYQQQRTFQQAIDVVDAGNMCLRCTTQDGFDYIIITKTIYGKIHILKFGPYSSEVPILLDGFDFCYKKFDYNEKTIAKEVNMILNDPKKKIQEVSEILPEEIYMNFPNLMQQFQEVD